MNQNCGDEDFKKKVIKYKNSNFKTVKDFLDYNSEKIEWTHKDIEERNKRLSELAYVQIWKII